MQAKSTLVHYTPKQFLERSIDNKETALAYNELGLILLALGQEDEAIKTFNKALNLNKNQ
jgi:tetratricopeptide (TPR) repeat protein